jgi:hypothetical protein
VSARTELTIAQAHIKIPDKFKQRKKRSKTGAKLDEKGNNVDTSKGTQTQKETLSQTEKKRRGEMAGAFPNAPSIAAALIWKALFPSGMFLIGAVVLLTTPICAPPPEPELSQRFTALSSTLQNSQTQAFGN